MRTALATLALISACAAWPQKSQAALFHLQTEEGQTNEDLDKAFNFVASYIKPKSDHNVCPIKITFTKLNKSVARALFAESLNGACPSEEIQFAVQLKGSWKLPIEAVHEITHLLRYEYNSHEEPWLDEGLAQYLQQKYTGVWPANTTNRIIEDQYLALPVTGDDFEGNENLYSSSLLFLKYLIDHFGQNALISGLLASPDTGWINVEKAARQLNGALDAPIDPQILNRDSIWKHFAVALLVNDPFMADYGLFYVGREFTAIYDQAEHRGFRPSKKLHAWSLRFYHSELEARPATPPMLRLLVNAWGGQVQISNDSKGAGKPHAAKARVVDITFSN